MLRGCPPRPVAQPPGEDGSVTDVDQQHTAPAGRETDEVEDEVGGAPARQSRRPRDMALSLIVLLIPVAIIAALVWVRGGSDPVVIDTAPAIAEARAANAFPVTAPHGLDSGWRPVSAAYDPGNPTTPGALLRIGYVTATGGSVQLIES